MAKINIHGEISKQKIFVEIVKKLDMFMLNFPSKRDIFTHV